MSKKEPPPKSEKSAGCCDWKTRVDDLTARASKMAREEPAKAVGIAFATGIVFTILPVGRVIGGLVRLAFALVPPGLLMLGGIKLWEEIEKRSGK
jgi:hypothetical protein